MSDSHKHGGDSQTLDNYWMPFTANRQFKQSPRLLARAQGMYYTDVDGNQATFGGVEVGHEQLTISFGISRAWSRK